MITPTCRPAVARWSKFRFILSKYSIAHFQAGYFSVMIGILYIKDWFVPWLHTYLFITLYEIDYQDELVTLFIVYSCVNYDSNRRLQDLLVTNLFVCLHRAHVRNLKKRTDLNAN